MNPQLRAAQLEALLTSLDLPDEEFAALARAIGLQQPEQEDVARQFAREWEESEHPRGEGGKFAEQAGTGQKRAAKGGELGPNGEWYPPGAFIATTTLPKMARQKLDKAATGAVEVEPGKREVPEPGKMAILSIASLRPIAGAIARNTPDEVNDDSLAYLGMDRKMINDMAARYASGERWLDVADFPELMNFDDAARIIRAGMALPKGSPFTIDFVAKRLGVKASLLSTTKKNAAPEPPVKDDWEDSEVFSRD